jgi:ferredoxin
MMMGLDPSHISLLATALGRGLGEMDMSQIEVTGDTPVIPNFKTGVIPSVSPETVLHCTEALASTPPDLLDSKCNLCGDCVKLCPRGIISINHGLHIERDKCIACYACVDGCPEEALEVPQRLQELWDTVNTFEACPQ